MESESLKIMRKREATLDGEIDRLMAQLRPLREERGQVRNAIRAMLGEVVPIKGIFGSNESIAHHKRKAHPEIQNLTLKELVIKALTEQISGGATANQLLDLFERRWGKKVARTSLSPQLSRLKAEGKIALRGKVWYLANENGEAEASPRAERVAALSDNEPSSGEHPTQNGPASAREESP